MLHSSPRAYVDEEEERELRTLLRTVTYMNEKLTLHFVRGHNGYDGNELADGLCTEVLKEVLKDIKDDPDIDDLIRLEINTTDLKRI